MHLATSTYPIDREFVANELGFSKITLNSLDSVSDRDYVIETLILSFNDNDAFIKIFRRNNSLVY